MSGGRGSPPGDDFAATPERTGPDTDTDTDADTHTDTDTDADTDSDTHTDTHADTGDDRRVAISPEVPLVTPRVDLRLLGPAIMSWAALAAALGLDSRGLLAVVVATLALGVVAALTQRRVPAGFARSTLGLVSVTSVLVALLCSSVAGQRAPGETAVLAGWVRDNATVVIVGTVRAEPRPIGPVVDSGSGASQRRAVDVDVDVVTARGQRLPTNITMVAMWTDCVGVGACAQSHGVTWRSRVQVSGRLRPAQTGQRAVAVVVAGAAPRVVAAAPVAFDLAAGVRHDFVTVTSALPADAAGLVPALVVGERSATPHDLRAAMLTSGLSHLSAVSGTNVTIVVGFVLWLCGLVGVRRRWRPGLALVALASFVLLARLEPSVVRAAVMGAVGLLALDRSRRRTATAALGTAIVGLLTWDPWLARSVGFALSCTATLGIVLWGSRWAELLSARMPARARWSGAAAAVPLAAHVACAPITVMMSASVSWVSVPANVAVAPLVAPVTLIGFLTCVLAPIWAGAATVAAWLAAVPALGIAWVARVAADIPAGAVPWPATGWGSALLALLLVVVVVAGPVVVRRLAHPGLVALLATALVAAWTAPPSLSARVVDRFTAAFCAVGQGDAAVISTGPGHAMVVDVGPDPVLIDRCLRRLQVSVVDAVLISHFHADHVDGLPGLARSGRRVDAVFATAVREPAYRVATVTSWAQDHGLRVETLSGGAQVRVGRAAVQVLGPSRRITAGSVANNGSLVLLVAVDGVRVALLGDIEREAATAVLGVCRRIAPVCSDVDVLKVTHHGSANTDPDLVPLLSPDLAVISVGADNDYGHPAPSTLDALHQSGATVRRTDRDGDVIVSVDEAGAALVSPPG